MDMNEYVNFDLGTAYPSLFSSSSVDYKPPVKPTKGEALLRIRELFKTRPDIDFSEVSDDCLSKFIHARKFDVDASFKLLVNYLSYKKQHPTFLDVDIRDPYILTAIKDGLPGVLEERDRKGRKVLVYFANRWNPNKLPLEVLFKALIFTLDLLLEDIQNQVNGLVFLIDWTNFSFRLASNLSPRVLKSMIEGLQDCYPARFKGIHFVGQPWYVEAAVALVKPFLKEKARSKIFVHGNNVGTMHEYLPCDILPTEFGGDKPPFNSSALVNELLRRMGLRSIVYDTFKSAFYRILQWRITDQDNNVVLKNVFRDFLKNNKK